MLCLDQSPPTVAITQTADTLIGSSAHICNCCGAIEIASRGDLVSMTYKCVICAKRDETVKVCILNGNFPHISIMQTVSYLLKWPSKCNAVSVIVLSQHS